MAHGDYVWKHVGSSADQEKCMQEMCFLGVWALQVVEAGWFPNANGETDDPIWDTVVYKWDQDNFMYVQVYTPKFQFRNLDLAKEFLEDWYANNVLFEHLVWKDDVLVQEDSEET